MPGVSYIRAVTSNYSGARQLAHAGTRGVLVTGASSGIGLALATQLAAAGIEVVALGRNRERLEGLARRDRRIVPLIADLADLAALPGVAARALDLCPALDCVIHNAAIQRDVRFDAGGYGADAIREELDIDLVAPLILTRHLLAPLQARDRALVVTVGSVLAIAPRPAAAAYGASKAGLASFSRAMAVQSRGTGVRFVHAVMPLVDTQMAAGRGSGKMSADAAADALLAGLTRGKRELFIGKARLVPWLQRLAPGILGAMMRRM
jgi:uncharacterized oxidoreductase